MYKQDRGFRLERQKFCPCNIFHSEMSVTCPFISLLVFKIFFFQFLISKPNHGSFWLTAWILHILFYYSTPPLLLCKFFLPTCSFILPHGVVSDNFLHIKVMLIVFKQLISHSPFSSNAFLFILN